MELKERLFKYIKDRRNKVINGGINSIPSPFKRFSNDFIGSEQGVYTVVTSGTKVGKTNLTSFLFLYNNLLYAYYNPTKVRVKFFYYPLEETPEDILLRFTSYLLFKLFGIRCSTTDLKSSKEGKPLDEHILEKLEDMELNALLDFFEENVVFSTSQNPTGIYLETKKYAEDHGKSYFKDIVITNEKGDDIKVQKFDYYEPDDPDEYKFIIVDHAALIAPERGMTNKQSIDKLSEYFVLLRNRYKFSPILILQQAFAGESLENFKLDKLRPTVANFGDSRYPGRDCSLALGLFSPYRHDLKSYLNYDISIFKDNIRFLEVLINRNGQSGGLCPLFFDGTCCFYDELPLPSDERGIQKVYTYLKKIRGENVRHNIINIIINSIRKYDNFTKRKKCGSRL